MNVIWYPEDGGYNPEEYRYSKYCAFQYIFHEWDQNPELYDEKIVYVDDDKTVVDSMNGLIKIHAIHFEAKE